jgi:hypothetical protein
MTSLYLPVTPTSHESAQNKRGNNDAIDYRLQAARSIRHLAPQTHQSRSALASSYNFTTSFEASVH